MMNECGIKTVDLIQSSARPYNSNWNVRAGEKIARYPGVRYDSYSLGAARYEMRYNNGPPSAASMVASYGVYHDSGRRHHVEDDDDGFLPRPSPAYHGVMVNATGIASVIRPPPQPLQPQHVEVGASAEIAPGAAATGGTAAPVAAEGGTEGDGDGDGGCCCCSCCCCCAPSTTSTTAPENEESCLVSWCRPTILLLLLVLLIVIFVLVSGILLYYNYVSYRPPQTYVE
ncbi:PREDICTED: cat eye syndrome critical region protein 6 homolog, partial [Nicrophorus vespilloides]|uniref:Cat eye syndrome critical region protein 6 homolog n=1 Tax=Nicrophorus vespilloides TaxID=110193 RepID=A0ABM1MI71_NICVS